MNARFLPKRRNDGAAMNVVFYGAALDHTGGETSFVPAGAGDIRALIGEIGARYGESFKDALLDGDSFFMLINGKGIMQTGGLDSELHPGDKIEILPFIDAG